MSFRAVRSNRFPRITGNVLLIALFLVGHFSQAASSPEIVARVNRLIDVSGIAHSARQILPGILSGMDTPQQSVPANVRRALRDAATQAFQPGPTIDRIRARLSASLSVRELDETLAWLDSHLGRRITAMENAAAEPTALAHMQAYGQRLQKRPPEKNRVSLIGELNRATGSSEMAATILEGVVLASALGFNASQPVQQQVPIEIVRQQLKSSLPQLRQQSDQMVTLSLFYVYRSLPDRELESYLKFLKSPSGAAYSHSGTEAFREAMLEAIGRFMLEIPKALAKHKGMADT